MASPPKSPMAESAQGLSRRSGAWDCDVAVHVLDFFIVFVGLICLWTVLAWIGTDFVHYILVVAVTLFPSQV